ncbi:transmembrane protein 131 isoform X2 [Nematostella vectensis]|uniref:transmembrane protein 131 isoform X2 n=1 Tax=Nematostella vectensis TaxID=45351 RepID=UPI0020770899|nr:transmembrane protein 131 isoform X2 [Nematostella vectensis]
MAASLGPALFLYITLVFLVTHRICLMQCNPMPGPGMYHGDMGDLRFSGGHVEGDGSVRDRRVPQNTRQIRFDPPYLDFLEQPVGMPIVQTVTISNPHPEQSLQLNSISGSTGHFHASFFRTKVVQPVGNTTFDVVFLARLIGSAENTLFIHTSKGVYPYQVFGVGIPNPYRLRPFLGARVPVNFSFTSLINMHNPYSSPLQVVEMYSSGQDLHLELPSGRDEAPQGYWEIPPYETKTLMRVSFVSHAANNHTAFIRIKTSTPAPSNEFLILPVEVEVTTAPGLFSSVDMIDFGTLRTMDEPKTVGIYLLNSGPKQVHVSSVAVEPGNSAVSVTFSPVVLKQLSKYSKVASITYSAYHVKRSRQFTGKIVIKTNSKSTPKMEIPYQANVLQGTIAYSVSKTRFFVGKPPFLPVVRELPITNTFSFSVIIYDATFPPEVQNLFSIVNFTKPALIKPHQTATPFYVHFVANGSDTSLSTILRVYTNASIFTIPIHCYDGKIKYVVNGIEEDVVDYGTVGTGENRTKTVKLINNNPIEVIITNITCNLTYAIMKLIDTKPNNNSRHHKGTSSQSKETDEPGKIQPDTIIIKPAHTTTFSVEVVIPKKEGQFAGEIQITTDYEVLHIPIYFRALDGQVTPSPLLLTFPPTFPGRTEVQPVYLHSTFSTPLNLVTVRCDPADGRFTFRPLSSGSTVEANTNVQVGSVQFKPSFGCKGQCYMGLGTGTRGTKWLSTLTLPSDVGDHDNQYAEKLQRVYDSLKQSGNTAMNVSLIISTDLVRNIPVQMHASLTWPSLAPDKPVKFPLTHVGNFSTKHFFLENPADVPVVVQVLPLSVYPPGFLDVISDRFDTDTYSLEQSKNVFSLPGSYQPKNILDIEPSDLQEKLGVTPADHTLVTILGPRSREKITVQFSPQDDRFSSSVLLLRNNLTVVDIVAVQGQGARGEFMLNGRKPGLDSTLLFELKSVHLSECHKDTPRTRTLAPISVKKVLTATNPGQLAIQVNSISISGYECEGYGFKVLNCKSFILNPNTSRRIEIAFTPDFTMSRVTRKLEVKSTFGPVMEFMLVATIPPHLLPLCAAATGRSNWGPIVQGIMAIAMGVVCVFVVMAAYSEAKKILGVCLRDRPIFDMNAEEIGQVFDLNAIAGVKPKMHAENRHVIPKRIRSHDSKADEKTTSTNTTASASTQSPTNNNVNKNNGNGPSQDSGSTRNRSPKQASAGETDRSSRAGSVDSLDGTKKNKDTKQKESRTRNAESSRKSDTYRGANESRRDYRAPVADIDELKQSIANVQEQEEYVLSSYISCAENRKDTKDNKSKSKKKSKNTKRDEKEQRFENIKDRAAPSQDRYDDAYSDDSGSDGSDKTGQEVKVNQSNDRRRRVSLPNDSTLRRDQQRGHQKKNEGRPRMLDIPGRMKDRTAALQAEAREPGPTSPHAIAAAVMSHLEKTLPSTTKENCNDTDNRRKASGKATGNAQSPTNLSSRSSSYSSIVSDGSSSGGDHAHALKHRLTSTKSMPVGDRSSPSLLDNGFEQGSGKHRHPERLGMSALRRSPWSISSDSALAPGARSPVIQRPFKSLRQQNGSPLYESQPFRRNRPQIGANAKKTQGVYDLSTFGVSDRSAVTRARPSVWSQMSSFNGNESLFSSPPAQDDHFSMSGRPANNWVNFLDVDRVTPSIARTDTPNNRTVSEIWDAGNMPAEGDGWSLCGPPLHPEFNPRAECESDPVDSLFSEVPPEWSTLPSPEQNAFGGDSSWASPDMSAIWGEQYSIPSSESLPVSSAYQPSGTQSPTSTFTSLADLGSGMIWPQTQWSNGKD